YLFFLTVASSTSIYALSLHDALPIYGGDVGQHDRHRVALADAATGQRRGQASAACVGFRPVAANGAVDNRRVMRVDGGRALDEAQRGKGDVVDGGAGQALFVDRHARYLRLIVCSGYVCRGRTRSG